jgi:hypothetical protein
MKPLLIETTMQRLQIVETDAESGLTKIRGVAGSIDTLNGNKRVYPRAVIEKQLPMFLEESAKSNRIGAVDHPDATPRISDLALRFTDLKVVECTVQFEAIIIPTIKGKDLEALIRAGVAVGISSRGYGSVKKGEWKGESASIIQDDYELVTYDAVVEPSVADARILAYEHKERNLEQIDRLLNMDPEKLQAIVDSVVTEETVTEEVSPEVEAQVTAEVVPATPIIDEALWSTAEKDALPDSSFAYIAPGGKKDEDGKTTPRSLRHLPYKDADGKPDAAHVRDALSRLPDTDIPADAKDSAKKKLDSAAKELGIDTKESLATETPVVEASAESAQTEETPAVLTEDRVKALEESLSAEQAKVVTLAEEKVALVEAKAAVEAKASRLKESAESLGALLVALKTAIGAEFADDDWDDVSMLAGWGQQAAWRASYEDWCDATDMDDAQVHPTLASIEALKDLVPAYLKKAKEAKVKAAIFQKTREEKYGRAIANVLTEAATSTKDVEDLFENIKTRVIQKLNDITPVVSKGDLSGNVSAPRWNKEQIEQRRLMGLPTE